jgi:hypothetical protein
MKKSILSFFILAAMTDFASAQSSFSDLLSQVDQSMVILAAIFLISFSLLFFSLKKFFKSNKGDNGTAGIISAILAFLLTYWVNQSGFSNLGNFSGFFLNFGISQDVLMTIIPIVVLIGAIFVIIKLKKDSLLVFGGLCLLLSFFVYDKTVLIVAGVILIAIRFFIPKKRENPIPIEFTRKRR